MRTPCGSPDESPVRAGKTTGGSRSTRYLIDLTEFQFYRRGAAKDHNPYPQATFFVINFFNHTFEIIEGSISDAHHFPGFVEHLGFGLVDAILNPLQDNLSFLLGNRCWSCHWFRR